MTDLLSRLRQWTYPPALRLRPGKSSTASIVSLLSARTEEAPVGFASLVPSVGTAQEPDKELMVNLCNQMHRLGRSVAKAKQQGDKEADRLQGHFERVRQTLKDKGVTFEDLSGQAYSPDNSDFEPLGAPQPTAGLRWNTILLCERPAVFFKGKIWQVAKGVVGAPFS